MNLVDRVKNIIVTPKTEWAVIEGETPNVGQIMTGYVVPLALIPALGHIIGWGFIGMMGPSLSFGIVSGVIAFAIAVLAVYVVAYVVDFLAPNFGSQKNIGRAFQLVAYSSTPGWVAGVFYVVPALGWIAVLASLYGLYVMYLGLPAMMKTPQDKVVLYLIVAVIAAFVVYAVVGGILGAILFGIFGIGAMGTMGGWF